MRTWNVPIWRDNSIAIAVFPTAGTPPNMIRIGDMSDDASGVAQSIERERASWIVDVESASTLIDPRKAKKRGEIAVNDSQLFSGAARFRYLFSPGAKPCR